MRTPYLKVMLVGHAWDASFCQTKAFRRTVGQSRRAVYGNGVYPPGTSRCCIRLQIAFLFPEFTKEQDQEMMEMKLKQLEQEQQQTSQPKK
jgi:hypothetical protein